MPANKYALLRYRIIDKCIRNKYRPYPTKERLREACEEALYGSFGDRISPSTIDKDIAAMKNEEELGYFAPIKFSKTYGGYFYETPDYSINQIPLNEDDIEAIKFAVNTLQQFKEVGVFKQFDFAIDKLFDRLNISHNIQDEAIEKYVLFEKANAAEGSEYLPQLLNAIKQKLEIAFDYQSFTKEKPSTYKVYPALLKEYSNRWYLISFDPINAMFRTFGLDRISNLLVKPITYEPLKFDPDRFFKHSIGITADYTEPIVVKVVFDALTGKYLKSQPLHPSQLIVKETDKKIELQFFVLNTYELRSKLLGFGSNAEVLSPLGLRKQIAEEIRIMSAKYL